MTNRIAPDAHNRLPADRILANRYLIQEVIGVGGMGAVYRARDLHFQSVEKLVAVKEMINQAVEPVLRQAIIQNFEREANILVTLSHPSIPKIFDFFSDEERSYLVLEYIQGKDLESFLNETQGFLPEEQVVIWAIELCHVLHYLHTHKPEPILFRDLKPSNIMINQQNHVILVDFGIAKNFRSGQKGTMIGTEGYSPPEQYRGEMTFQTDIYALGATLHHLITRHDPRMEAPFTFADRPVRRLNPAVSAELEAVIHKALQYDPKDRYQSAEAMKEALLMVGVKTGVLNRVPLRTDHLLSEQRIKPLWTFVCGDEIRGSAVCDGEMVYFGAYDKKLYALHAGSGDLAWSFEAEGGIVSRPLVAGGLVYFGSEDQQLYALSRQNGKLVWSYSTKAAIRSSPRIVEGHIFIGSDDGYLHAVNTDSCRCTWRFDAGSPIRSTPCLTRDGIYFGSDSGDFYCLDFKGQTRWRFKAKRSILSSPLVWERNVYFGSLDATFYAMENQSGWVSWRYRMAKGSVSTPCQVENLIFTGSVDGNLYCLEAASGKEVWRFKTGYQVSGSPVIYKDYVYCGAADGSLYCLDYRSGQLHWKFNTSGPITAIPYVADDVIYIGALDHTLYALMA